LRQAITLHRGAHTLHSDFGPLSALLRVEDDETDPPGREVANHLSFAEGAKADLDNDQGEPSPGRRGPGLSTATTDLLGVR
jgi:hypothetical protein